MTRYNALGALVVALVLIVGASIALTASHHDHHASAPAGPAPMSPAVSPPPVPAAPATSAVPAAPAQVRWYEREDDGPDTGRESQSSSRSGGAWLGVALQPLDDALRQAFDFEGPGVLVNSVVDGSPADDADLRAGDIITHFDGGAINSVEDLQRRVKRHGAGPVDIEVIRRGRERTIEADLAERQVRIERREVEIERDGQVHHGRHHSGHEDAPGAEPRERRFRIELHHDGDGGEADHDARFHRREHRCEGECRGGHGCEGACRAEHSCEGACRGEHSCEGACRGEHSCEGACRGEHHDRDHRVYRHRVEILQPSFLGVRLEGLDEDLASYFEVEPGDGVLVIDIVADSPAEASGLRSGDIITHFDGDRVTTPSELRSAVHERQPGDEVAVRVVRRGRERTVDVTLTEHAGPMMFHGLGDLELGQLDLPEIGDHLARGLGQLRHRFENGDFNVELDEDKIRGFVEDLEGRVRDEVPRMEERMERLEHSLERLEEQLDDLADHFDR